MHYFNVNKGLVNMSSFSVEQNLKKAKSLVSKGKSNEALFLYKEITDKFRKKSYSYL